MQMKVTYHMHRESRPCEQDSTSVTKRLPPGRSIPKAERRPSASTKLSAGSRGLGVGRNSCSCADAWGLVRKAYHFINNAYNEEGTVDASNLLRQAIELAPGYAPAHAFLGFYLIQCVINQATADRAGDREKALAAVEHATRLAPGDAEVLENAGLVLSNAGKSEKAVPTLRRAVEIAPFNLVAWGYLALALAWRDSPGDQEEALKIFDRLLTDTGDHPSYPYWLYFRSLAYTGSQRFEDAADAAARSVQAQPLFFLSRLSYANALGVLGRLDEARAELKWIPKNHPHVLIDVYVDELYVHACSEERVENYIKGLRAAGAIGEEVDAAAR